MFENYGIEKTSENRRIFSDFNLIFIIFSLRISERCKKITKKYMEKIKEKFI